MLAVLRYRGALYRRVIAVEHPLSSDSLRSLSSELKVAITHLDAVVKDASNLIKQAHSLKATLVDSAQEIAETLKKDGKVTPNEVHLLDPNARQECCTVPLHSMEKASRQLTYTVDAAISTITTTIEQVDAMVDDQSAALESQNAPNTSSELTAPTSKNSPEIDVPTL